MARPASQVIAMRNERLVQDFIADKSQSYKDLSYKFGISGSGVYQVLKSAGVINRAEPKCRNDRHEAIKLPNSFPMIGAMLEKKIRDQGHGKTEVALWMKLKSVIYLSRIFRGQADLTYTELESVARYLGYPSATALLVDAEALVARNIGGR